MQQELWGAPAHMAWASRLRSPGTQGLDAACHPWGVSALPLARARACQQAPTVAGDSAGDTARTPPSTRMGQPRPKGKPVSGAPWGGAGRGLGAEGLRCPRSSAQQCPPCWEPGRWTAGPTAQSRPSGPRLPQTWNSAEVAGGAWAHGGGAKATGSVSLLRLLGPWCGRTARGGPRPAPQLTRGSCFCSSGTKPLTGGTWASSSGGLDGGH